MEEEEGFSTESTKPQNDSSKNEELVIEAKNFFDFHKKELGESLRKGNNVIYIDFMKLTEFSNMLSDELLANPEEVLRLVEMAIEESGLVKNVRVRLYNTPPSQEIKIREIRSKHLNELITIEGIIRQASDVRPQVVNAKFECPSCGTVISVLQLEKKFREPTRCSCGRRGGFRLISKEMVDTQRLVIEESPEALLGGEQPKRMNVFVKEDLVEPKMEEKTTPGARVKAIGVLKEVPVPLSTGGMSTRFELAVEANNVIPMEETFEELDISDEDERQILELAADPSVFDKLASSITPSVWGYEEIKRSLVLQLFGGVQKKKPNGGKQRGDIHILLIGDPGVAKSIGKDEKIRYISREEVGCDTVENIHKKFGDKPKQLEVLTIDQQTQTPKWESVSEIIKHLPEKDLINVMTKHGKKIIATKDHSFITLSKEGKIIPIKGEELKMNSYLPIPINYHKEKFKTFSPGFFNKKQTNSKLLPEKIKLEEDFGFFIGIFLAEGYIKNEKTVEISNKNSEIQNKVIKFTRKIKLNYTQDSKSVKIFSKNLCDILKAYCYNKEDLKRIIKGTKGNYSRIKKVPEFLFFAPREFVYGLLSGIFSGDGRLIQDKKMLKGFELVTTSKYLSEDISDLLLSVGIINKIKAREYTYKNKKTPYFSVSVPTYMIKQFLENINIFSRKIKFNEKNPVYSYNNLIPCGDLVYEIVKKLGYNKRKDGNRTLASEMRTVKKRGEIGRIRLLKLLKEFESRGKLPEIEALKKIANSNILWSRISNISILEKKNEEVYDLSIPSTNTFVANGIGVHNSVTLGFMANISPKGRYVVGKSASGAGLTATVVRDEYLKGWSLEAGAMVLAHKGLVCIDELEKMDPQDRSAMHEAMEQQCYHYNTLITLADGSKHKIGKLVERILEKNKEEIVTGKDCLVLPVKDLEIFTTDFKKIFKTKIDRISKHKAFNKFIKITYSNKKSITVTPEHPVFIIKNKKIITKRADSIKKGEFVPTPLIKNKFSKRFNSNIGIEKISKVEIIPNKKEKWVYDVTIEPYHTFISNGMILHNTVTVSKANVQAQLKAETSVLAAANPKFGRFDPYQSIAQQIDLPPTLINRFDIIFTLRDIPSRERDDMIATHVLEEHRTAGNEMLVSRELFRKYVAYTKQRIKPELSDEAITEIKKFYVDLRNKPVSSEAALRPIPISARQLQALIRLSEASAKVRLSKKVLIEDARRAIEIMKYYLMQVGYDYESKTFDIDKVSGKFSFSQRSKILLVKDAITALETKLGKMIPLEEVEKEVAEKITKAELEDLIQKLKQNGEIFEPRRGFIQNADS